MRNKKSFSYDFPKEYSSWRDGFVAGNGRTGIIQFCSPSVETVVFCHRRFFFGCEKPRSFNQVSRKDSDRIRRLCAESKFEEANRLAAETVGWQDGGEGKKHPGFALSLKTCSTSYSDYIRECDFASSEIRVSWTDNGKWKRKSFVSREKDIFVLEQSAPDGISAEYDLSLLIHEDMHLPPELVPEIEYNSDYFSFIAKYPGKCGGAGFGGIVRISEADEIHAEAGRLLAKGNRITLICAVEHFASDNEAEKKLAEMMMRVKKEKRSYEQLFASHSKIWHEYFDRVSFDLDAPECDRALSNEKLIEKQRKSDSVLSAMAERAFDSGRYHFISCCCDTGAPDLLGLWTGDFDTPWWGYYHLDANLNLQMSQAVTNDLCEMANGYYYLLDAWKEDFRTNATKLLNCRGLLAGGNSPGESSGLISYLDYEYPYHYATGEMPWLIYPMWEQYLATKDAKFLKDRIYPYLLECADFYSDFLIERDKSGKYIFAGSVSPENQPSSRRVSLVSNSSFDIGGARFALKALLDAAKVLDKNNKNIPKWQKMYDDLPCYRINSDGALAEYAWDGLDDHYSHRHLSHLIGVWPYREITTDSDKALVNSARKALDMRDGFNYSDSGHGLLHAALIGACLGCKESFEKKLLRLLGENYYYSSMMTAHQSDGTYYCADVCHTMPTLLTEMLVTSTKDTITILPVLPDNLESGSVSGILTLCGAKIETLAWQNSGKYVVITFSAKANTKIKVRLGHSENYTEAIFERDGTKTLEFKQTKTG